MTQQYLRKASLIVGRDNGGALDLSELRFRFDIRRGDLQTPNSARVRVYNVSDNTAQKIEREFTRLVIQGGYEGNYGILFDGSVVQIRRGRDNQTDTYLDITAADGDSAYNFAVVNATLAAGSTSADHVAAACTAMNPYGVSLGYAPWGKPAQAKPTADDIAAQQAAVDAAKKTVDDNTNKASDLVSQGIQLRKQGDAAAAAGDSAAARQYYLQAKALNDQAGSVLTGVNKVDLPRYNSELDKLKAIKEAATQPDTPSAAMSGLPRGKVMFGMARDLLRVAAKTQSMVWSIQDGKLQMNPETSYVPGDIPVISAATGLVGLPEQTQNGITVKMLLNPSIKIGRLIQLDNKSIQRYEFGLSIPDQAKKSLIEEQNKLQDDGFYYVMVAEHTGDTRGNDWYTEVICLSVDATAGVALANTATPGAVGPVPPRLDAIKQFG